MTYAITAGAHATGTAAPDVNAAVAHFAAGRYSEARSCFAAIARSHPGDVDVAYYEGRLALWSGDVEAAVVRWEELAKKHPDDARLQNALGDAYAAAAQRAPVWSKLRFASKCRMAYQRAVELAPENVGYRFSLLGYFLVAPRMAGGGEGPAASQAAAINETDPRSGRVAWATYHLLTANPSRAFALFDEVLAREPDDVLALYQVGRCAAVSGEQLERGLASLRRCLALAKPAAEGVPSEVHLRYRLANILERIGDHQAARLEYERVRTLSPDFRPGRVSLRY